MRLLLVQSSHLMNDAEVFKSRHLLYPGLALPIIASLTPDDVDIEIVNDYWQDIDYDDGADLVGITAMTPQAPRAYQIAEGFRRRGRKVVLGGFHASLYPEEASRHCDAVCVGEGEDVWPRMWTDFLDGKLEGVYRAEGHPDLAGRPAPRYDLISRRGYALLSYPVQTTRGCPKRCDFCSVHRFFGGTYRHRPVDEVVRDIRATQSPYIFFIDDNIAADKTYTMELLEAIKPLGIVWGSQCDVPSCEDEEFLRAAADSGCLSLFLGVESVEPSSLQAAKKGFNHVEDYGRILRKVRETGIAPIVSMICGMEGDTVETFEKTRRFVMENEVPIAYWFILCPAPGTDWFDRADREGRLLNKDWSTYNGWQCAYRPKHMTPEELETGFWELFRRFYSLGSIWKRVVWPPSKWNWRTYIVLKFNLLHYFSLRRGVHPLSG